MVYNALTGREPGRDVHDGLSGLGSTHVSSDGVHIEGNLLSLPSKASGYPSVDSLNIMHHGCDNSSYSNAIGPGNDIFNSELNPDGKGGVPTSFSESIPMSTMNPSSNADMDVEERIWSMKGAEQNTSSGMNYVHVGSSQVTHGSPIVQATNIGGSQNSYANVAVMDMSIPRKNVDTIIERYENTLYGYFIGKQMAFLVVEYYGLEAILEGGPWMIRNAPIILKKWSMDTSLLKEESTRIPVWVKLHDVPLQVFYEDGISIIATHVEVDSKEVLKESLTIGIPLSKGGGFSIEISMLRHTIDDCPKKVVVAPHVDHTNDGFQQVVNKKRNTKGNMTGNKPSKGGNVAKGVPIRKGTFIYQHKAANSTSKGDGVRGDLGSKGSPNQPLNKGGASTSNASSTSESHVDVSAIYETCKKVCRRWKWTSNRSICDKGYRIILGWNDDMVDVMIMSQTNQDHSCGGYEPNIVIREFKDCTQSMKIMDVNSSGLHFTWNQKPKGSNGILKKIDRIMGNLQFNDDFPGSFAIFQPYRISDHPSCVLRIPKVSRLKPKPFKFFNFLVYKKEFLNVVESGWGLNVEGFSMYQVVKRLKGLKSLLHKLLHAQGNLHDRVNTLRVKLDEAQKAIDRDPSYEERFLRKKSKVEWLEAGDSSTAYFHRVGMRWQVLLFRYEQFLGSKGTIVPLDTQDIFTCVLDSQKADVMVCDITDSEIRGALFSMCDDKAPGLDGKPLKEVNHTLISLIPKVSTPSRINDYRPISCCNFLYKCISKIIANRIKDGLGDLVSINQLAFVPGRRILDNILLTGKLMRNYHRRSGPPRCAFKVDIQKAYDNVDWNFLKSVLVGFGFHQKNGEVDYDDLFLFARGHPNFVHVIMNALEEFKNVLGSFPVRYLGVPLKSSRLLYQDCRVLVKKLKIRASIFILPASIIHDLEQLMRGFLWCQREMKKGKAKVVWESVCMPKQEGGLGIRRSDDFNVSLMATHICRSRVRPFILHEINSGKSTSMWFDKWNELCPIRGMPSVRDIVRSSFSFTDPVSDLIAYGYWRWPPDWHNRFPNLVSTPVPSLHDDLVDVVVWRDLGGSFRPFSVAGSWDSLCLRADVVYWYHVVWFPHCIPWHVIHIWLVVKEKLKTRDRLRQWDVGPNTDFVWIQGRLVVSVVSWLLLAATSYYLWNERNSRLFKKKSSTVPQIVEVITSIVRLKLVTFKFKKVSTCAKILLDKWKILSSSLILEGSAR
ncbi:sodium/hydrogen exchanger 6 [Tanacetum coccineum]